MFLKVHSPVGSFSLIKPDQDASGPTEPHQPVAALDLPAAQRAAFQMNDFIDDFQLSSRAGFDNHNALSLDLENFAQSGGITLPSPGGGHALAKRHKPSKGPVSKKDDPSEDALALLATASASSLWIPMID
jgi:hypothetical protein